MAHFARSRRVWIVLAFLVTLATASDRLTAQSPPPLSSPFAVTLMAQLMDQSTLRLDDVAFDSDSYADAVKALIDAADSRIRRRRMPHQSRRRRT